MASYIKKIVGYLTGYTVFFILLDMILFKDKQFTAMMNIMLLYLVIQTIGIKRAVQIFTKQPSPEGTTCFCLGFFLVLKEFSRIGVFIESYGILVLFSIWPRHLLFIRKIPISDRILQKLFIRLILTLLLVSATIFVLSSIELRTPYPSPSSVPT